MNFGLDKLVEMIEERFGRLAGTIVLAALAIAALAFAVHALFSYLIIPVVKYAPDILGQFHIAMNRLTLADAIYALTQALIGCLGAVIFFGLSGVLLRRYFHRINSKTKNVVLQTMEIVEECRSYSNKTHKELGEFVEAEHRRINELIVEAQAVANEIMSKAEEKAGLPKSEPLLSQPPKGTASDRRP